MGIPAPLKWISLGGAVAFALFLVAVPLAAVSGQIRLELLRDPVVLAVVRASLLQASLSTLLSAVLGLALGLWIGALAGSQTPARLPQRLSRAALEILGAPFGVPTLVAAMVWVSWAGYGLHSVVLAHVFLNAPWMGLLIGRARAAVPDGELDAAESLGAGELRRWRAVIWPRVRLALASGGSQVFALCTMSFAIVLILGGGPPVETLESAIYAKLRYGALDFGAASALACWEILMTILPWAFVLWLESRAPELATVSESAGSGFRASRGSAGKPWVSVAAIAVALAFVVPYLAIFGGLTRAAVPWTSIWTSGKLAALVSVFALAAALCGIVATASFRANVPASVALKALMSLPAGISTMVLGLGIWCAYRSWLDPFAGSIIPVIAVQATLFVPLAFRMLLPLLSDVRRGELEAAATLGASPLSAFFRIEWPRWRGPVTAAFGLIAGVALSELAAVSLFYSERLVPLPLLISRWMAQYRFEDAQGASALLLILSLATIWIAAWLGSRREWKSEVVYAGARR